MQVGGIGNQNGYDISHQVTDCVHEHDTVKKETGGMKVSSDAVSSSFSETTKADMEQESLGDALQNLLERGKQLIGHIWGESGTGVASSGMEEEILTSSETEELATTIAAGVQQAPKSAVTDNPYFTTHSDPGKIKEPLFEKIRVRLSALASRMSGRFGERLGNSFSTKSNLQQRKRSAREDLRKKSKYRQDDLEIDCVLTDDSYLMDSYDRKGEYSRLSTENKHSN